VARLYDRMLRRAAPLGYSERDYTGAEYVGGMGGALAGRESAAQGIVRRARQAHADNGIVFAVEAVKTALFAEARFTYQALTDGHEFGDTSLALLEHPWPNADSGELLTRMAQDATFGNSYMRKATPADGSGDVLVQMRQEQVTIVSQEMRDDMGRIWRQPVGYLEETGPGKDDQFFTVDEVGHFSPVPDPKARWRGMSWLTPILTEVHSDKALTQYKQFHLDNGAMPGLVVKYSMKLSDKTIGILRKRIRARYGGPENAGNVLVLDEGADMAVAGSSLQDLQFDAVSKAGERRVCAAAGPGLLVICGFEQGDPMAAVRQLADFWARPRWRMACAALEHLVGGPAASPQVPVRLWYDVAGIAALREGELTRAQAYLVSMQAVASSVQGGFTRDSAVAAAAGYDISLLKPDPNAPPPGVSGRATERVGQGGFDAQGNPLPAGPAAPTGPSAAPGAVTQPPTGGPRGGSTSGGRRAPQAGRPQQLPGSVKPNLPAALPASFAPMPALPGGARGGNGRARRSEDVEDDTGE